MRKLKLEMQLSIDGFAADSEGKIDWMIWQWQAQWKWDQSLQKWHTDLQTSSDTILFGKLGKDFIEHWQKAAENKDDPRYAFASAINSMKKLVFSKSLKKARFPNTELIKGDFVKEVQKIKRQKGKDIIVYGGMRFVSSLIKEGLIDEYNFIINPVILGKGKPIFKEVTASKNLVLKSAAAYDCGVAVMVYANR